ncbi:protein E6-like [Cynara cardunculus var. scolymus]|uniref:protein E6-like n=1 Tax=Cynara cardunculus var. scolymus TaxID=59895 RepID=UPI000D62B760|nr:protein E6-like [Cynara cardunculus var. scolymus]
MAATTIFTTLLLLLTISATIHGRESQFFAKVSNNIPQEAQPLNTNQQDSKTGDSYGLYGHESGQLPPSATTTTTTATTTNNNNNLPANLPENYNPVAYTTPIHSSTQNLADEFTEPQAFQYNGDATMYSNQKDNQFSGNGDNDMYNSEKQEMGTNGGNMYYSQKQGMSDTRFLENGRYYSGGDNGYNPRKQGAMDGAMFAEMAEDGGNMYNSQKQENGRYNQGQEMYNSQMQENGRYNQGQEMYNSQKQGSNGNMYNTEKQGMSDTRFLESGKYYYDLNSENLNANANMNSRGFQYNNKGYYGNNDVNSYERYNSNGGYQNQDEFQENQEDQFNP